MEAVGEAVNMLKEGTTKIRIGWGRDFEPRPITVAEVASVLVFVLAKANLDQRVLFRCHCMWGIVVSLAEDFVVRRVWDRVARETRENETHARLVIGVNEPTLCGFTQTSPGVPIVANSGSRQHLPCS